MMIALWQTLIEHLLSWPVAIFFLALVFRKPLADFFRGIDLLKLKGGPGEVEFSRKADQQIEAAERTRLDPLSLPGADAQLILRIPEEIAQRRASVAAYGGDRPLLLEEIKALKADLESLQFVLNTPETTEVLIRHLAATQLMHRAELLYRIVFGSQVAAMEKMNQEGPLRPEQVIPFFERAKARSPAFYGETTFASWVGFLIQQKVVAFQNGTYGITLYGRDFLAFIAGQGLAKKAH